MDGDIFILVFRLEYHLLESSILFTEKASIMNDPDDILIVTFL